MAHEEDRPPLRNVINVVSGNVDGPVVSAGAISGGVHYHQRDPVFTLPYRSGSIPPRATSFQSREDVLWEVGCAQTTILTGLGGVGKTQIALDYAERLWAAGEVDLLAWITADSQEVLISSYANLAMDLTGIDDPDAERGAQRLLAWLANTSARWLVVLDDILAPADLRGWWPQTSFTGRVVATTRRRGTVLRGHNRAEIDVDVFISAESESYLHAFLTGHEHLLDGVTELAATLGHLPLALAQAGAYLLDRNLSCKDYRSRFVHRRATLASLFPDTKDLQAEHQATVATTWSLSVDLADQLTPAGLARPLLTVASLLDANGIPIELFKTSPVVNFLAAVTSRPTTSDDSQDGLSCLHRLSLVTLDRQSSARAVRVHALVQRATRESMPAGWLEKLTHTTARALNDVWPATKGDPALGEVLRANTDALESATDGHLWNCNCRRVLFSAGFSYGESGAVTTARDRFARLHAVADEILGCDHPDTLFSRSCHARWTAAAGNPSEGVALLETLLSDCIRTLGVDAELSLRVRNDLAFWRAHAGDPRAALVEFQNLLPVQIHALGPDHLHTLTTRANIARFLAETGVPETALGAFEMLLPDIHRALGLDHVLALSTAHNLAYWRGMTGDPNRAVESLQVVLADRNRVLGKDHPHTLSTRGNIARFRRVAGDPVGAANELKTLVTDRIRVLGEGHPETIETLFDSAECWTQVGNFAEAATAYETLLTGLHRASESNDPILVDTRRRIVECHIHAADLPKAVTAIESLIAEQQRILGQNHPDVLATKHKLTILRRLQ